MENHTMKLLAEETARATARTMLKASRALACNTIPDAETTVGGGKLKVYAEGGGYKWYFYPDSGVRGARPYKANPQVFKTAKEAERDGIRWAQT